MTTEKHTAVDELRKAVTLAARWFANDINALFSTRLRHIRLTCD